MSRITESLYRVTGAQLNESACTRLADTESKLYKETEELAWELESMHQGSSDHAPDPSAWDILREKEIRDRLHFLMNVGLDYLTLSRSADTLSGGEAQRVKLASELYKKISPKSIFILDEPTTGLHSDDVNRLLAVLNNIVDRGGTVVVIEHNLDVIKQADYIIDLGPEGGVKGGNIVACGRPEEIIKNENSYTGKYLKKVLK